jgi:ketose-bisphosphate aldolase
MPIVPFKEMMQHARHNRYAVGYFECWDSDSIQAVAEAAEATRSPVLLGFSGIYLPDPARIVQERFKELAIYGLEVCKNLAVPANLVFNESPYLEWVHAAIRYGFGLVMYTDDGLPVGEQLPRVMEVAVAAHRNATAVEGELAPLPGLSGDIRRAPDDLRKTDPNEALKFVETTQVDALAVNIGQAHLHGRLELRLDLERLENLARRVPTPLVLHGASSVSPTDLKEAIQIGIRKVNVGSRLKQTYFEALRRSIEQVGENYNPYEVIGSGKGQDVMALARLELQQSVQELMDLFGSAGRAQAGNDFA